jgi:hypothetical protein
MIATPNEQVASMWLSGRDVQIVIRLQSNHLHLLLFFAVVCHDDC